MHLPRQEHQEPVQARLLHERCRLQAYPRGTYRDSFEHVTWTPKEVENAIVRGAPLSPAAPRLRVVESSLVAVPTSAPSLSSILAPSSTSVPSTTLVVSTLTASLILTPAPSAAGIVLVKESSQTETATVPLPDHLPVLCLLIDFQLQTSGNPWLIPDASTGTRVVIYAVGAALPALMLLIVCMGMCRPLHTRYSEYRERQGRKLLRIRNPG
ncbi:hypothetical protein QBC36DRAFT_315184 [Triangularia setosa]|uniref:Uncharacterized protein n=1 Tax=Triangularia setosa TaxID=2587417 RepID=A0AAN6W1N4_9PEZI|nr:hypothetical protein QBC36DRAFT_315184 [Podospora setosa]